MGKRFIKHFSVIVVSLLLLIGGFNFIVDPYSFFNVFTWKGFNEYKGGIKPRKSKLFQLARVKPKTLILGTSRAENGFSPYWPNWPAKPVYNAAFGDASIYEIRRFLEYAHYIHPLKIAWVEIDIFEFNALKPKNPEWEEVWVEPGFSPHKTTQIFLEFFSLDMLFDSLRTVYQQTPEFDNTDYLKTGFTGMHEVYKPKKESFKEMFTKIERYFLHVSQQKIDFIDQKTGKDSFEELKKIIRFCKQNEIQLYLVIAPSHARIWESMIEAGIWPKIESWKRKLIEVIDQEKGEQNSVQLWDFTHYNSYTMEPVPEKRDAVGMEWFNDGVHFKSRLGTIILQRVLTNSPSSKRSTAASDLFGTLLNKTNIDLHLNQIRNEREYNRQTLFGEGSSKLTWR